MPALSEAARQQLVAKWKEMTREELLVAYAKFESDTEFGRLTWSQVHSVFRAALRQLADEWAYVPCPE